MVKKLLALAALAAALVPVSASAGPAADCSRTSVGLTPLTDLGARKYKGFQGGLYPGGKNVPPAGYLAQGVAAAAQVEPIDGRVVLLSIGFSNATYEFSVFKQIADADPRKSPELTIVDGAIPRQSTDVIRDPRARYWRALLGRLLAAGVRPDQVQVIWMKTAIAGPTDPFPAYARRLRGYIAEVYAILRRRFPNLKLLYLASRTYAGYSTISLNPEPYAYQGGFAVKWFVEDRIRGKVTGPWVGWGPYLWTDGTKGRSDGLVWTCADVIQDGVHPTASGRQKVAELLLRFFTSDPTATPWFVRP
ncbi:MAG TPA: hypothetical protein VNJ46_03690 [Gaiellaceae bacterium]|nr:hypothetical protein [Gaiellaceae bacterium]